MDQIDIMVKAVQDYVRRCFVPVGERLSGVEERIAALDARLAKLSAAQKELAAVARREPGN